MTRLSLAIRALHAGRRMLLVVALTPFVVGAQAALTIETVRSYGFPQNLTAADGQWVCSCVAASTARTGMISFP